MCVCVGENTHQWEAYPKKSLLTKCREKFPSHESATTCVPRNRKKSVLRDALGKLLLSSLLFTAPVLRCVRWDWERTFDKLKVNSLYRRKGEAEKTASLEFCYHDLTLDLRHNFEFWVWWSLWKRVKKCEKGGNTNRPCTIWWLGLSVRLVECQVWPVTSAQLRSYRSVARNHVRKPHNV